MSDNCLVIVGLKGKEFKNCVVREDGDVGLPKGIKLSYASYGYESGEAWKYDLKSKEFYSPKEILAVLHSEDESGTIYGVYVVGTWSGAIDLESIQEYIDEAKRIFKERSGQEGKVYVIGEQV